MINTPRITILEYELIVNKKLFDIAAITEQQYNEVNNIIYEKINRCKQKNQGDNYEIL